MKDPQSPLQGPECYENVTKNQSGYIVKAFEWIVFETR